MFDFLFTFFLSYSYFRFFMYLLPVKHPNLQLKPYFIRSFPSASFFRLCNKKYNDFVYQFFDANFC